MAERVTRQPLCTVKGCPYPSDPDWHIPFCQEIKGHKCFGGTTHQHFPSRAQAGKGAKIVACICAGAHQRIDQGNWGNSVLDVPGVGKVYRIYDLHNNTLMERIIEAAPEEVKQVSGSLEQVKEEPPPATTLPAVKERERTRELLDTDDPTHYPLPAVKEPASKPAVQYGAVGLRLPENLTRAQWEEIASTIQQMVVSVPWWVGDVLVYGQRYGEEMWQAIKDRGGADYERLRKYMWVAERVPIGTRVPALKWSHHREVADLKPDEQRAWLQRAQDDNLSANALRVAISGEEPEPPCPESATGRHEYVCKHCGKER